MTDYPYIAPCSYSIIYAHALPGSVDHAGLLKVGDTTIKSPKEASELTVNCAELKAAALANWKRHLAGPLVETITGK